MQINLKEWKLTTTFPNLYHIMPITLHTVMPFKYPFAREWCWHWKAFHTRPRLQLPWLEWHHVSLGMTLHNFNLHNLHCGGVQVAICKCPSTFEVFRSNLVASQRECWKDHGAQIHAEKKSHVSTSLPNYFPRLRFSESIIKSSLSIQINLLRRNNNVFTSAIYQALQALLLISCSNQGGVGIRIPDQGPVGRSGRPAGKKKNGPYLKKGFGRSIQHGEL